MIGGRPACRRGRHRAARKCVRNWRCSGVNLTRSAGQDARFYGRRDARRYGGAGYAGIEDLGDVGMVHQGQGLALSLEASDDTLGVHAQLDDLEGDAASDRFLLLGHIDHTAPAFADLLKELIAANPVARLLGDGGQHRRVANFTAGDCLGVI